MVRSWAWLACSWLIAAVAEGWQQSLDNESAWRLDALNCSGVLGTALFYTESELTGLKGWIFNLRDAATPRDMDLTCPTLAAAILRSERCSKKRSLN